MLTVFFEPFQYRVNITSVSFGIHTMTPVNAKTHGLNWAFEDYLYNTQLTVRLGK
jgi:hypothetical protein